MDMKTVISTVAFIGLSSTAALAIDVEKSIQIAKSPDEVWAAIGEFCAISDWHPVVATCEIQDKDGTTHRLLTTGDGAELLEKQLGHDDATMVYEYAIMESPLPVADYVSSIKVEADGDGSRVVWASTFAANGASDEEATGVISGIYDAGLAELALQLGQ